MLLAVVTTSDSMCPLALGDLEAAFSEASRYANTVKWALDDVHRCRSEAAIFGKAPHCADQIDRYRDARRQLDHQLRRVNDEVKSVSALCER